MALPNHKFVLKNSFVFFLFIFLLENCHGIKWLALSQEKVILDGRVHPTQCRRTRHTYNLPRAQAKLCTTNPEIMPHVTKAATQALDTCQQLFETRRWNCSSILLAPNYMPDLTTGTREQAFVYALSSASLVYVLSKACASGDLFNCSCASHPKEAPNGNFKWGGCGDNVRWATQFAKRFTDSTEKRLLKGRGSPKTKRGNLAPIQDLGAVVMGTGGFNRVPSKTQLAPVNLHNSRAGRKEVERSLKTQCACHGVSGSCSIKICWKGLPKYYEVGENLQKKYIAAHEVSVRTFGIRTEMEQVRRNVKALNVEDLVYVTKSPDYCLRDDRTGSLGTRGRYCNETSRSYDSCDVMCCGRGHTTLTMQKIEMCHCKFHWCCEVVCKKCVNWVDTQVCN